MRKIRLSDTDASLFDEEMLPADYEYLARHKDTFCRMWMEQGRTFWKRYLEVFRSYIVRYSLLGDLPCDIVHLEHALEHAFKLIEKNFVEGKANQAKSFLYQIADLGRNRHKFGYLDSKSVSKDPFYTKDTRDLFRDFFGQAKEKSSYIRVYLLTPVYMRFGGSIVRCLVIWKDADEIDPSDESYYTAPLPIEYKSPSTEESCTAVLCAFHLQDCNTKFYQVALSTPSSPINLDFWPFGDPRFEVPGNPLYDPQACRKTDWREGLTMDRFSEWYCWCIFSDVVTKPENQCADCRARKKAKKKKQKKKKKTLSTLADFGYDDESLMADAGASWAGVGGESSVRAVNASGDGHLKGCPHAHPDSSSKFATLDTSIAVDVSDRFKKKNQFTQNSLAADSAQQKSNTSCSSAQKTAANKSVNKDVCKQNDVMKNNVSNVKLDRSNSSSPQNVNNNSSSVDPSPKVSASSKLSSEHDKSVNNSEDSRSTSSNEGQNGPVPSLPMTERIKQLETRVPGFCADSESKRMEAVPMPAYNGNNVTAHFEVIKRSDMKSKASQVEVILRRVAMSAQGKRTDSKKNADTKATELGKRTFPELTSKYLSKTVEGFSPSWLCAESDGWCAVEVDYSFKEKETGTPTYFILKVCSVSGASDLNLAKDLLVELLWYVVRRKKRPSAGWVMQEEDVFAFCQTLKCCIQQLVGVSVIITTRRPVPGDVAKPETSVTIQDASTPSSREHSDSKGGSDSNSQTIGSKDLVKKVAEGKGSMGVVPDACLKADQKKQGTASNNSVQSASDKGKSKVNGAVSKPATSSAKGNTVTPTPAATSKKNSQGQPTPVQPAAANGAASAATLDDRGEQDGDKGKKKKKKNKNPVAVAPAAAANPPASFPLNRTAADNLALSNAKTHEELAQIIARMAGEGKVDHLSQACITSAGPQPPGSARAPLHLPIAGSGDASQTKTGERQKSRCSYCGTLEPALRTFKKCLRCKEESVPNARYYCGRPCQVKDWKMRHNHEHQLQIFL